MKNKINMVIELLLIIAIMPFISASACSGTNCGANMSLNIVNVTNVTTPPTAIRGVTGQAIFDILDSSGTGLYFLFNSIGIALPVLIIGFVFVAIIVAILWAIFHILHLNKKLTDK